MDKNFSFTPELFDKICDRIANGESLRAICRDEGMPNRSTFVRWCLEDEQLASKCARAREQQADYFAEQTVDIGDEANTAEEAQIAKVRISARQWFASKVAPKKYGDRITHQGDNNADPIKQKMELDVICREASELIGKIAASKAASGHVVAPLDREGAPEPDNA